MATDKLAKAETFSITPADLVNVQKAMAEIAGEGLGAFDFPEIGIPAGGGLTWEVPTLEGATPVKSLECIILDVQRVRQYYATEYSGEGVPPDCASPDACRGIGTPGGDCATCPLAQWGSGDNNSQACSERRHVLLLMPDSALPYFLNVPPSSIKAMKGYLLKLSGAGVSYYTAVTRISLEKARNAKGIEYSHCVFEYGGGLPEASEVAAREYRDALAGMLRTRVLEAPRQAAPAAVPVDDYVTA